MAPQVSEVITNVFWIHNAPFEIAIGTWFLYEYVLHRSISE